MLNFTIGYKRIISIRMIVFSATVLIAIILSSCQSVNLTELQEILSTSDLAITPPVPNEPQGPANMPNPASQHCEQNGGTLQLRVDANGGQYGVCVFADNTECEEWAFYRGECRPGGETSPQNPQGPQGPANMPNPASQHCEQNGGTLQIRVDANGGRYGVCVFADNTECEEWAFYRGECRPGNGQPQTAPASQHTYQNAALGFSLDAPAGWTVWEAPNMVQFQRQAYTLFIGYWLANQSPPQIRAGMPEGEYQDAGQFTMAGYTFQKRIIAQQGQASMVDFGHGLSLGPLQLSIWLEGPPGQGKKQAFEIPPEVIAEAEAILNSFTLQP